jgi:hypothetical protein
MVTQKKKFERYEDISGAIHLEDSKHNLNDLFNVAQSAMSLQQTKRDQSVEE